MAQSRRVVFHTPIGVQGLLAATDPKRMHAFASVVTHSHGVWVHDTEKPGWLSVQCFIYGPQFLCSTPYLASVLAPRQCHES